MQTGYESSIEQSVITTPNDDRQTISANFRKIADAIRLAHANQDPESVSEQVRLAGSLLAHLPDVERETWRKWIEQQTKVGTRVLKAAEMEAVSTASNRHQGVSDAIAQVLWEGGPEKVTRPVSLVTDGAVAVVTLPTGIVKNGQNQSEERLFVVTSEAQLLTIAQAEGKGMQFELDNVPPCRWSKEGIKRFLHGQTAPGSQLHQELVEIFSYYAAFAPVPPRLDSEQVTKIAALSVLVSFFTEAFPSIFYLHFHGPKGSGKSKVQKLHADLSFNGEWVIHTTTPAAVRRMAASGGVISIDDTETLSAKEDPERYSMLLSGYRRGATFTCVEDDGNGGKRTRDISIYGMRTFSAIREMPDTLRSRLIMLPLVRSAGPQANRNPDIGTAPGRKLTDIADDAMAFALPRLRQAETIYSSLACESVFAGRDFEIVAPFLTVAQLVGGKQLASEAEIALRGLLSMREDDHGKDSAETIVLRSLQRLARYKSKLATLRVSASDIASDIENNDEENAWYTDDNDNLKRRYRPDRVGKIMSSLRVGVKGRTGDSGRYYEIDFARLDELFDAYGVERKNDIYAPETVSQLASAAQPASAYPMYQ